jgi:hypothetical protein
MMNRRDIKITFSLGLVIAAVVLTFPVGAQASTNVVPNPGFEQGGCGGNTPVLCGWASTDPNTSMSQDTTNPHTGSASMSVECAYPACDFDAGAVTSVSTDPAFCAPIGPGAHQASFWFRDAQGAVWLGADFYQGADCTGSSSSTKFSASPAGSGWQQAVGALAAPLGTQSAVFWFQITGAGTGASEGDPCSCGIGANLDDVYVDDVGDTTPPAISSFTPTSGPAISTFVSITGTNLTGTSSVTFNGTAATDWYVQSSTNITAFVPRGATTGPISVTTPFGTSTSSDSFTVTPEPPVVCCSDPTSGPVGTTVDIMGGNFAGATSVTFNGTADPDFVVNSPTDITAHVPAGATTGPISVTTPGGTASTGGSFTVTPPPPPTIGSFTPTSGPVGTSVDIQGTNFTGATSVMFNGAAASYTVNSPTSITARVPSGATTGSIAVTTPFGTVSSSSAFTVVAPPKITSFTPPSGHAGQLVTITGTNLSGATAVTLGTTDAKFTVGSSTTITATVPTIAHGSYKWSVTTPAGAAISTGSFHVT